MKKMTKQSLSRIIRESIRKVVAKDLKEAKLTEFKEVDPEEMKAMMDIMDANLTEQENPKVGIFWYSPRLQDVFGVVSVDAKQQAQIEKRALVTCKELHKYVWKKQYNYYKYHGGSDLFVGDYKDTPRGRIFYVPKEDRYDIMVGSWIKEHPEAEAKIKEAFDLTDPKLNVEVKIGIHWEIGMGYGE